MRRSTSWDVKSLIPKVGWLQSTIYPNDTIFKNGFYSNFALKFYVVCTCVKQNSTRKRKQIFCGNCRMHEWFRLQPWWIIGPTSTRSRRHTLCTHPSPDSRWVTSVLSFISSFELWHALVPCDSSSFNRRCCKHSGVNRFAFLKCVHDQKIWIESC